MVRKEHGVGVHGDGHRPTDVITSHHLKRDVVKQVFECIGKVVYRLFVKHLLPFRTLHIKSIGDTTAFHVDGKAHFGTLNRFYRLVGKANRKGERLLKFLLVAQDTLCRLHGKMGQENHQGHQHSQEDQEKIKIAQVTLQIDSIRETQWGQLLGTLFDGGQKQFIRSVGFSGIRQLQGIEQFILDLGKEPPNQQGRLLIRHLLPETHQVDQGNDSIKRQYRCAAGQQEQKKDEPYTRRKPGEKL